LTQQAGDEVRKRISEKGPTEEVGGIDVPRHKRLRDLSTSGVDV